MPMCLGPNIPTEPLQAAGNHTVEHRWILQEGGPALPISDQTSTMRVKCQVSGLEAEKIL